MNTSRFAGAAMWRVAGAVWMALVLALAASQPAQAAGELSKDSAACMKCHEKPDLSKKLGDGKALSLSLSAKAYLEAAHKEQDCTDCHAGLDDKDHGKPGHESTLASRRELTTAMQDTCTDCHKKKVKQYADGIHAALVKAGNDKAPLCADCHNAHTQPLAKGAAQPIDKTPCASCHETIFKAYSQDVHGLERVAKGKKAPICADCHFAHETKAASLGDALKDNCLTCHKEALAQHKEWLPNAALHFEAISCPVCHAPGVARRVNLRLYDAAGKAQLREKAGVPQFAARVKSGDVANVGLDERALYSLLEQFSKDRSVPGGAILRGRLEVKEGPDAHRLAEKGKAVSDCDSCHAKGAEAFQSVVISIAGPDGRPLRHGVQSDVLSSLTALQSVRGFYAIGSTRIQLLDWLLAAAVAGSLGIVIGHLGMRWLTRGVRARRAAQAAAAAAGGANKA